VPKLLALPAGGLAGVVCITFIDINADYSYG
jgi:hypothetical protein